MPLFNVIGINNDRNTVVIANSFSDLKETVNEYLKISVEKLLVIQTGKELDICLFESFKNQNDEICLAALQKDEEITQSLLKYLLVPKYWNYIKVIQDLSKSETVDICFLVDCTDSMEPYTEHLAEIITECLDFLKEKFPDIKIRLALIGYQDFNIDIKKLDFTQDMNSFKRFLKSFKSAIGIHNGNANGNVNITYDEAEDVLGGLQKVTELEWQNKNRLLIHICDAPAHGKQYYLDGYDDDHPDNDPTGSRAINILKSLTDHDINYIFFKINNTTDKMINRFDEILADLHGNQIKVFKLLSPNKLLTSIMTSITLTIVNSKRQTIHDTKTKPKKSTKIVKMSVDYESDDKSAFKTYSGKCYKTSYMGNITSLKNLMNEYKQSDTSYEITTNERKIDKFIECKADEDISISICKEPFAKGNFRYAYIAYLHKPEGKFKCVVKSSLFRDGTFDTFEHNKTMLTAQIVAKYLAEKFNNPGDKAISFNDVKLIYINETKEYFTIEKYIDRPFLKWNNNVGIVNEEIYAKTLDSFAHWTYVATDNYLLVSDLQGFKIEENNEYILTDPSISCVERQFSSTDLGQLGISMFFDRHKCNEFCKELRLPSSLNSNAKVDSKKTNTKIRADFLPEDDSD